jgi:pSer/pThr/pTyr-binding forkhead associated (FHA) protein
LVGHVQDAIVWELATHDGSPNQKRDRAMSSAQSTPAPLASFAGDRAIVVGSTPLVIGRDSRCDVRLHSLRVSRYHCCLTDVGGEVVVRDLGSTNGLRINGQRVTTGRLKPGDTLSIGQVDFSVEADAGSGIRLRQSSNPNGGE